MAIKLIYPTKYNPKHFYHSPKIEVRKSKVQGVGVFATKAIKKYEVLEEDPFIILKGKWKNLHPLLKEYIFAWTKELPDHKSQAALVFGCGTLFNSSPDPNADWDTNRKKNRFIFYALKNIKAGEEIMLNYGDEYWESREKEYIKK